MKRVRSCTLTSIPSAILDSAKDKKIAAPSFLTVFQLLDMAVRSAGFEPERVKVSYEFSREYFSKCCEKSIRHAFSRAALRYLILDKSSHLCFHARHLH